MKRIKAKGIQGYCGYGLTLKDEELFFNSEVMNSLSRFKKMSDVILANKFDPVQEGVIDKVYTRGLYFND